MKYYFKNQTIAQPADNDAAAAQAQPSDNNALSSFIGEERALQIAFEFEIDAATGAFLESSAESIYD